MLFTKLPFCYKIIQKFIFEKKRFWIIVVDEHDRWDLSDRKSIIFMDTEEATSKTLTFNGIMHIYT